MSDEIHMLSSADLETDRGSASSKPTMEDLWRAHPEIQNGTMIEAPGIPYIRVAYVFCGLKVTQEEFDAVLSAFNRLAGTCYTRDDIAGVQLAPVDK